MGLVDVIKCDIAENELVGRYEKDDISLGAQLIVYPGQTAFFMKGGTVCDQFEAGTYTLSTDNIPLLKKLVNIPFGGKTPFKAEVWFVNRLNILDIKWGTSSPLQLEDPKYGIIVPLRAYGQYGIQMKEPRLFLDKDNRAPRLCRQHRAPRILL